ncbi:ribosome recycling factor [Pontibacter sp. G13]|uniref:ribosome recycling factor n=1 Tax=Pontibacter sp. G13 TaxID=3074898 RepID=UPI00288BF1CC|nr:ribosome recycling factor [Pontibacter sp. G13]WNJ16008.1 ribosome recycling factor [Pontibacter sp. G13]
MDDSIKSVIDNATLKMDAAIEHLKSALLKIRAGKASPDMLDSVRVDYYGTPTPVAQVAKVSAMDARTITVTPWEKNMIPAIEKAIRDANLGFNPGSDGEMVRVPIPSLTEDRRKTLVKQAKAEGEDTKVSIRSTRKDANNSLKQLQKDGESEDAIKGAETQVQDLTNSYSKKVDDMLKEKEGQIMTI